jgi:hypothetical protein
MLLGVGWWIVTDVSEQNVCPILKDEICLDCSTLADETDRLSRNVGNYRSKLGNIPEE